MIKEIKSQIIIMGVLHICLMFAGINDCLKYNQPSAYLGPFIIPGLPITLAIVASMIYTISKKKIYDECTQTVSAKFVRWCVYSKYSHAAVFKINNSDIETHCIEKDKRKGFSYRYDFKTNTYTHYKHNDDNPLFEPIKKVYEKSETINFDKDRNYTIYVNPLKMKKGLISQNDI